MAFRLNLIPHHTHTVLAPRNRFIGQLLLWPWSLYKVHDQFLVPLKRQTHFSDRQCQEYGFPGSLLMVGGWEKVLNLERKTEETMAMLYDWL